MATRLDPRAVELGEILAELRFEKGLSVFEMASAIGLEVTELIAIEAGLRLPTSSLLASVCALFDVPVTVIPKGHLPTKRLQ